MRTRDHVVPLARGGDDKGWNVVYACNRCNNARGSSWPTCACETCRAAVERHRVLYGITETSAGVGWVRSTRNRRVQYGAQAQYLRRR